MARRKLSAKQIAAGFGGKRAKRSKRTARRTTRPRRAAKRATTTRRRTMRFRKPKTRPLMNGALGGAAAQLGARFLGNQWGPGVGTAGAGYMLGDDFLSELGAYELGSALVSGVPVVGSGQSGGFI